MMDDDDSSIHAENKSLKRELQHEKQTRIQLLQDRDGRPASPASLLSFLSYFSYTLQTDLAAMVVDLENNISDLDREFQALLINKKSPGK